MEGLYFIFGLYYIIKLQGRGRLVGYRAVGKRAITPKDSAG
jgi:hypothetical protein